MSISKYPQRRAILLAFVMKYIAKHSFTPSPSTLRRHLGWPQTACQGYLRRLRQELPLPPSAPSPRSRYPIHRPLLLRLIQEYTASNGFAPTLRNLAGETGLAPATLHKYLLRMQAEGLVEYRPGISRSIRILV